MREAEVADLAEPVRKAGVAAAETVTASSLPRHLPANDPRAESALPPRRAERRAELEHLAGEAAQSGDTAVMLRVARLCLAESAETWDEACTALERAHREFLKARQLADEAARRAIRERDNAAMEAERARFEITRERERARAELATAAAEREAARREATVARAELRRIRPALPDLGTELRPDPRGAHTAAELIRALRRFRTWSGNPSYREMARRSGRRAGASTMNTTLNGSTLPDRLEVIDAIIEGCGGTEEDRRRFATAWRELVMDGGEPPTAAARVLPLRARPDDAAAG